MSLLLGQPPGDVAARRISWTALQPPPPCRRVSLRSFSNDGPTSVRPSRSLIAANAQIGAAKAEFFPRISLTGFFGVQSRALTDLFTGPARAVEPSGLARLSPSSTRGGCATTSGSRRRSSAKRSSVTSARSTPRSVRCRTRSRPITRPAQQRTEQERLVEALRESSRLATQRYQGGVDNYLPVLDAQRNLFQGELDLARLRQLELTSIVQLYRALGGGWSPS